MTRRGSTPDDAGKRPTGQAQVAVCWAVNFVVIDIGLESFPPLLPAVLRFGLTAFPAIFLVPRPDVRWRAVVAVGPSIGVGQFGVYSWR